MSSAHSASPTTPALERIASFLSRRVSIEDVRDEALIARMSLLDTIAVAIAGTNEPESVAARAYAKASAPTARAARLLASGQLCSMESAGFANAVAAHSLDFDDVSPWLRGHPSVMVWPALLALSEAEDIDVGDMLVAYTRGTAALRALASVMAEPMYLKGWHTTSTLGALGATAACAYASGLNTSATQNALAFCATLMSGLQQSFGTPAKSIQVGHGVATALRAISHAKAGLAGPALALEGPSGAGFVYAGVADPSAFHTAADTLESGGFALSGHSIQFKKYAMCYSAHRAIDGALMLRNSHGLSIDNVDRLLVRMSQKSTRPLLTRPPRTGLESKFSLEYGVARMLLDGQLGLNAFTDTAIGHPQIQAALARIRLVEDESAPLPRYAILEVQTRDGSQLNVRVDDVDSWLCPGDQIPQALESKVLDCLQWGGVESSAASKFIEDVMSLSTGAVSTQLLGALRKPQ